MPPRSNATERNVQGAIVARLRVHGWMVRELSQPAAVRGELVGVPDIIAWKTGVTLLVECKRPYRSVVRPSQLAFEQEIRPHEATTLRYIRTSDVDIFADWLIDIEDKAGITTVREAR
jgi:hypothetical protein